MNNEYSRFQNKQTVSVTRTARFENLVLARANNALVSMDRHGLCLWDTGTKCAHFSFL